MLGLIRLFLCATLLGFSPAVSLAQEENAGTRLLEEERRRKELEELERSRAGQEIKTPEPKGPVAEVSCFPIDNIALTGVETLKPRHFKKVLAEFSNQCLGQVSIGNLLQRISAIYADKGYITTRAYVPAQDISSRTLKIEVLEGKVEAFVYQQVGKDGEKKPGKSRKIKSAFPIRADDVFQLRDVEHGLEQMNRLRSTQAGANLVAGQGSGTSQIVITEQKNDTIRGTIGFDNRGDEATGRTQIRLGFEADDLLRLNDSYSLSYSGSENSNALTFSTSIPYRKWLFSFSGSYSESLSPVSELADLFTQTATVNLTAERLLYRNARSKYFAYATASSYWNERFINIAALTPQHRSSFSLGFKNEHRLEKAVISADTSIAVGAKFLNADWDPDVLVADAPRAEFAKLETRVTYLRPIANVWQFSSTLSGQITDKSLFSNEQISIGGWETVRGYSGFSVSGDSGAYLRNELSFHTQPFDSRPLGEAFEKSNIWNPLKNAHGGLRTFMFADVGYVRSNTTDTSTTLASFGGGFSMQLGATTINGTLAAPLLAENGQRVGHLQGFVGLTVKAF